MWAAPHNARARLGGLPSALDQRHSPETGPSLLSVFCLFLSDSRPSALLDSCCLHEGSGGSGSPCGTHQGAGEASHWPHPPLAPRPPRSPVPVHGEAWSGRVTRVNSHPMWPSVFGFLPTRYGLGVCLWGCAWASSSCLWPGVAPAHGDALMGVFVVCSSESGRRDRAGAGFAGTHGLASRRTRRCSAVVF